jgi:iron complex outermembrane receptor protein
LKKIRLKTAIFYNDITDAIISYKFTSGPNKNKSQNQNVGRITQYGIEVGGVVSVTENLEGGLSYTYIDRNNKTHHSRGDSATYKMTNVPEHKFFSYVKYMTPLKGLSLLGDFEYNSNRWNSESSDTEQVGTFALVNMKASYEIKKDLSVEAGIKNLFDREYEYTLGYPEPGRTYFLGMHYKF